MLSPPSIPWLRCPWARHRTPNCRSIHDCPLLWVCVFTAVCAHFWWVKCRARIPSMGHHTWLYATPLSLSKNPIPEFQTALNELTTRRRYFPYFHWNRKKLKQLSIDWFYCFYIDFIYKKSFYKLLSGNHSHHLRQKPDHNYLITEHRHLSPLIKSTISMLSLSLSGLKHCMCYIPDPPTFVYLLVIPVFRSPFSTGPVLHCLLALLFLLDPLEKEIGLVALR